MSIEHMAEGSGPQSPEAENPETPLQERVTSREARRDKEQMAREEAAKARLSEFPREPLQPQEPRNTAEGLVEATRQFTEAATRHIEELKRVEEEYAPLRTVVEQELKRILHPKEGEEIDPEELKQATDIAQGGGIKESQVNPLLNPDRYGPLKPPISLQVGYTQRKVEIPINEEGQRLWIRDRLAILENSPESWGSGANAFMAQEVFAVLQHLDIKEEMYNEVTSRQFVHEHFQLYKRTASKDPLIQISEHINPTRLNTVMHISEVAQAFNLLEKYSDDWLKSRGVDEYEAVRLKIAQEMSQSTQSKIPANELVWAVRLAERVWRITGRAVVNEKLEEGAFLGEGSGGDFVLRRLIKFKEWEVAADGRAKEIFVDEKDLEHSFDIWVGDFWTYNATRILGSIKDYFEKGVFNSPEEARRAVEEDFGVKIEWDNRNPEHPERIRLIEKFENFKWSSKEPWELKNLKSRRGALMGVLQKEMDEKVNKMAEADLDRELGGIRTIETQGKTKEEIIEDKRNAVKFKLSNTLDEEFTKRTTRKVDISRFPEGAYSIYMAFPINLAENFRNTVMGSSEGLFRNPTYEGLKKVMDMLDYAGIDKPDEWYLEMKKDLFERLLTYEGTMRAKDTGERNLTKIELDKRIAQGVVDNFIDKERGEEIRRELWKVGFIPGTRFMRGLQITLLSLNPVGGVWEGIKAYFKAAFSLK